jgi:glycosyltransferase involved in cell wall biosynthesis
MALIAMAVYCTEENKKDEYLFKTLASLAATVDFKRHRLILSVNGGTSQTQNIVHAWLNNGQVSEIIWNVENLGTAGAINKVIAKRDPGEHVIKIDDDVVIHNSGWADLMEEAVSIDPTIGIIGLKRKDLIQTPWHPDPQYRSELVLLPHTPGHKWITIERTLDVIGTCTLFNTLLIDKIGYSRQPGKYGFEDNLYCHRSHLAGFYNCFLNHIDIDHIDEGAPAYQEWKAKHSAELFPEYHKLVHAMIKGEEPIYYNPYE